MLTQGTGPNAEYQRYMEADHRSGYLLQKRTFAAADLSTTCRQGRTESSGARPSAHQQTEPNGPQYLALMRKGVQRCKK